MINPTSIHFKPLREDDLPLLHEWFQKPHIKQYYTRGENYTIEMLKEKYLPRIRHPELIPSFIVYADNLPIGYIQLYCMTNHSLPDGVNNYTHPLFDHFKPNEIAGIDFFIANENYLKKGYASLMISNFIKEQVNGKFTALVADPLKTNTNAICFLEKNGFQAFSENSDSTTNELMVLRITPYINKASNIILTTDRLILRTFKTSDILPMAAINADPLVMEHFPSTQDLATTQAMIGIINQCYQTLGYCFYAVETKDTHELIGFVGLNKPTFEIPNFTPNGLPVVEIGWRLSSNHWGKGYATEAAKAVLHYAFTELKLNEIISFAVVANIKSRHVMEKIGLHHTETDDFDHPKIDNNSSLKRHVLYRITNEEYIKIKN